MRLTLRPDLLTSVVPSANNTTINKVDLNSLGEQSVLIAQTHQANRQRPTQLNPPPNNYDPCKDLEQDRKRDLVLFSVAGAVAAGYGSFASPAGAVAGAATVGALYGGYRIIQNIQDPRAIQCYYKKD